MLTGEFEIGLSSGGTPTSLARVPVPEGRSMSSTLEEESRNLSCEESLRPPMRGQNLSCQKSAKLLTNAQTSSVKIV
jgi:hypothetical protein